jgi:hypothetical protein
MFFRNQPAFRVCLLGTLACGLSILVGCGVGTPSSGLREDVGGSGAPVVGILHGGPNPISGAKITLYTTSSSGYGAAATAVTSTTTGSDGYFTLPVAGSPCPAGEFAYVTAYGGSTGSSSNSTSLLMVPIGLCSSNYTFSGTAPNGTNTYNGQTLFINEMTTAVSAYALGNFMTVTDAGVINIGAPANNHATASSSSSAPSAAGLAHAFANALAIVNTHTGQPNAYTHGGTSITTGGVVPVAELLLIGNILQACVNTNGPTGSNTATSNDGTACGKLYSLTTPPQAMTTPLPVPKNTMQAMLDLAKYPNPSVNTWDSNCMISGAGTATATSCLFSLPTGISSGYAGALTSAPPDWALAIVYSPGYGAASPGLQGLSAPFYVALDYSDNVYVLNYDDYNSSAPIGAKTWTNFVGIQNDGTPLFSSAKDTTDLLIRMIATDTAGHVIGAQDDTTTSTNNYIYAYDTTAGTLTTTIKGGGSQPGNLVIDPFNNLFVSNSTTNGINLRKATYTAPASWAITTQTTTAPTQAIIALSMNSNLDLYELGYGGTTPNVYMLPNVGTPSAPSYATVPTITTLSSSATTAAFGLGANSSGNAFVIDSNGVVTMTKGANTSTTSGSVITSTTTVMASAATSIPAVYNSTLYNHYLSVDGANNVFSGDGANNAAASGVSVYDSADNLALGTYKGCAIASGATACSGYVANKNNGVAIQAPRGTAIDSAGDVWVVSAASLGNGSQNLTELIGAAAPTWPALSMAKFGRPQ